jgi:RHS repeat-associated protein
MKTVLAKLTLIVGFFAALLSFHAHGAISFQSPSNNAVFVAPLAATAVRASATAPSGTSIVRVEFYANDALIATVTTSPYQFSWNNVAAGAYTLTAKLIDSAGGTTTAAPRTVTVAATNTPPTVTLSTPATNASYIAPVNVPVSATAAGPELNDAVQRVEFHLNGALHTTVTQAPFNTTLTGLANGVYSLTAIAFDSLGAQTTSAARTLTIGDNQPPTVAIVTPSDNTRWHAPAGIVFQTQVAAPEINDTVRVDYYANGSLVGTRTTAPYSITVSSLAPATYTLTAVATDSRGLQTTSAARTIVVSDTNNPPTVSITSPVANASFPAPASQITISTLANAGEINGQVVRVEMYVNGTLMSTDNQPPYNFSWSNVPAGTYTLTAKAVDQLGAEGMSAPVTVVVAAAGAALYFVHADHLDTPRVITNTAGQAVWRWDNQSAFGENAPNENPHGQGAFTCNLRFPGQYFDQETGLHYNYFRDYDPGLGRYVESDPIGVRGGLNTYAYVDGNPVRYKDPLGLNPGTLVGGGLGSLVFPGPGTIVGGLIGTGIGIAIGGLILSEAKPDREQKPDNCPAGTKPVDKDKRLDRGKIHGIKDQLGAAPRDWVGITPDGRIITNEGGQAVDNGPYSDYIPGRTR